MAKKRKPKGKPPNRSGRVRPGPRWPLLSTQASRPRNKTWREAAGQPETAVQLPTLPAGVDFREGFPEPIAYDALRQALVYRGLMTHESYSYLRLLSGDPAYLAALDQLREMTCRLYAQPTRSHSFKRRWLWLLGAVAVAVSLLAWWGCW
jgi:hypothetical protein